MSRLIDFYLYDGSTDTGHTLQAIMGWSDDKLEACHDYIQWLFPTDQTSQFNPDAPVLSSTDRMAFQQILPLQGRLRDSYLLFLRFLGLEEADGLVRPSAANFGKRSVLFQVANHNWLRITRVIRSLRLLGLGCEARVFYDCLEWLHREHGWVSDDTFRYWKQAAIEPLDGGGMCSTSPEPNRET